MSTLRWVGRDEDMPHRCPECHAIATWDRKTVGPRTRLECLGECGVQWRAGFRQGRRVFHPYWGRYYRGPQ